MKTSIHHEEPLEIAIIGGGIVGLVLAIGLVRQQLKVNVYEQASGFREIGAGLAFTAKAKQCMKLIDPAIAAALDASGAVPLSSGDGQVSNDYLRWVDGYNQPHKDDPRYQRPLCEIDAGYKGFQGCRRDQFLDELAKLLPSDVVHHRKRLDNIEDRGNDSKMVLTFEDGSIVEVDAVIGCDGIKSRVREIMIGQGKPESYPTFTHKVAYRGLVPMNEAEAVLGKWKANNFHHHIGPNAHVTHYPVANRKFVNVTAFLSDRGNWSDYKRMVAPGVRNEVENAFAGWSPCLLDLVRLLPEELIKWALFDLADYPLPYYNQGRICLAGDAAHASSPHHGIGACCGIEDALCIFTLMCDVSGSVKTSDSAYKSAAISKSFEIFDSIRRTRTQWLVNSSRRVCELYHQPEWADSTKWRKAETCFEEIRDRSYKLWHFNVDGMVADTKQQYRRSMETLEMRGAGGEAHRRDSYE